MIIKYVKMKKMEIELKTTLYSTTLAIIKEQNDITKLVKNLYIALKDVPLVELRNEFIKNLSQIIHDENANKYYR